MARSSSMGGRGTSIPSYELHELFAEWREAVLERRRRRQDAEAVDSEEEGSGLPGSSGGKGGSMKRSSMTFSESPSFVRAPSLSSQGIARSPSNSSFGRSTVTVLPASAALLPVPELDLAGLEEALAEGGVLSPSGDGRPSLAAADAITAARSTSPMSHSMSQLESHRSSLHTPLGSTLLNISRRGGTRQHEAGG